MKIIKPSKNKKQAHSHEKSEMDFQHGKQSEQQLQKKPQEKLQEKPLAKPTIKHYSGSDIDIFSDDESWDNVEYSRTNTDLSRFNKKSKGSYKAKAKASASKADHESGIKSGSNPEESRPKFTQKAFSKSKRKKPKIEYQANEPLVNGKKRRRSELENTQTPSALEQLIDPDKKEFNTVLARGMRLLAIREHSVLEMSNKLIAKFEEFDASIIYAVVDELVKLKYISDERFTESYVRSRSNKGYGPVKIKAELKGKGVSNSLIQDYLNENSGRWFDIAEREYLKKYSGSPITNYKTWAKCARFMQSRGFTMEHIHVTLPKDALIKP